MLAKNTHYQDVNIEGLNPPFFMRLPTMQDRNPLNNKKRFGVMILKLNIYRAEHYLISFNLSDKQSIIVDLNLTNIAFWPILFILQSSLIYFKIL